MAPGLRVRIIDGAMRPLVSTVDLEVALDIPDGLRGRLFERFVRGPDAFPDP
jgi:hypothetical protein